MSRSSQTGLGTQFVRMFSQSDYIDKRKLNKAVSVHFYKILVVSANRKTLPAFLNREGLMHIYASKQV